MKMLLRTGRDFCVKRLPEYIQDLSYAIGVMRDDGKAVDALVRQMETLKAIYPNEETRIDLHEVFLEESRKPIPHLYVTKLEVFMMQNHGRVPEKDTEIYKSLSQAFYREN